MHIALYSPAWPASKHSNGIITYVAHLRGELLRQGHRVSVFTGVVTGPNTDEDVHIVEYRQSFARRAYRTLLSAVSGKPAPRVTWGHHVGRKILEVHRSAPIDVVEMEESFGWCADVQAVTSLPMVVKLHGPAFLDLLDEAREEAGIRKIAAEGEALAKMRFITSPSSTTLQQTVAHYQLRPELAETVPNPMVPAPSGDFWSLDQCDRRTLLFVGRFDLRKGGDIVLRAFRKLLESDPTLNLVFVGPDRGIPLDGKLLDFNAWVDALFPDAQRARIQYLGKQSPAEIPALRQRAMVTLVASRWDNQPNTVLEALMQGCPVVAIDTGGVGEIIEHGHSGLLAQPDDLDGFCAQIASMLADPQAAVQMGQRGREATLARHDLAKLARDTLAVYRRAVPAAHVAK
jgi:glycosyltransferase involved in cell wall biosynthesis